MSEIRHIIETVKKKTGISRQHIPYEFFISSPVFIIKPENPPFKFSALKIEKSKLKLKKTANIKKIIPAII